MKNSNILVGSKLIASSYCGFPDGTTKNKEYIVTKTEEIHGQRVFFILNDDGKETLPISTQFKLI